MGACVLSGFNIFVSPINQLHKIFSKCSFQKEEKEIRLLQTHCLSEENTGAQPFCRGTFSCASIPSGSASVFCSHSISLHIEGEL